MSEMSLSDVVPGLQSGPPPGDGRRSAQRKRERRRKRRRRRALVAVLVSLALVGGGVAAAWAGLAPLVERFFEPNDYTGGGTGEVTVRIMPGSSGATIGNVLASADVVKTPKAFVDLAKVDPKRAALIQPGTYKLKQQMSAASALTALLDPARRLRLVVTVPEGKRLSQILDILADQLELSRKELSAASKDLAAIGLPPALAKGSAEGFLFPSTYEFEPNVTPVEVLTRMVQQTEKVLNAAQVPQAKWREVIIKASVVQAEAGKVEDMPKVARVIDNRLAEPRKLEMDSTTNYAVGKFEVTTTAADRAVNSPYNTYKVFGLPAGPIGSPGEDAIKAALNPADGEWIFFVTVNPDTGETRFAVTAAEHEENKKLFQAWLRANG